IILPTKAQEPQRAILNVPGVCGMCKARIEKAAGAAGLEQANWEASTQELTLRYDAETFDLEAAKSRILAAGHDVNGKAAPMSAYQKLPTCCHYHDEANVHRTGEQHPGEH